MALRWKNSFTCNIREIDAQHKKLFEIGSKLNILEPICSKIDFDDEIYEVIHELKAYSKYHFAYEEKLLQQYQIEGFEEHKNQHKVFINAVQELERKRTDCNDPIIVIKIITFINDWITAHILQVDMKYKDYLNSKGIY